MTSNPSLKQTFLYPKLLKPLGANAIAGFNPVSLFPDGIPGYIAPKSQDFADSPFFFHNRDIAIATSNSQPQIQSKNQIPEFSPTPSFTQQEVNNENRERENLSQSDRTINLKSNIASDSASNLSEVDLHKNENITPAIENLNINQETRKLKSDYTDNDFTKSDRIIPTVNNSIINRKTITSQSDNYSDAISANKETITPPVENSITEQKPVTSESNNLFDVELYDKDKINSSSITPEVITPQSDNVDVDFTKSDRIIPTINNSIINQKSITSQSDNYSDAISADKETITPSVENSITEQKPVTSESNNLFDVELSDKDKINPSSITPEVITPQSDNVDVDFTKSDRIIPTINNSIINQKSITSQSDNYSDAISANKETITPSVENSITEQKPVTSELNNLFDVELSDKDKITPSSINPEVIAPQSDNTDIDSTTTNNITPTRENPEINRETLKPQSDNYSDVVSADKKTITSPVENSIINQKPVTSESNNLSNVELPHTDKITPSIQSSSVNPEVIAPQSDNVDVDSTNTDNISPARENPVINQETIAPQLDKVSDINSAKPDKITAAIDKPIINRENITPNSDNITDISATNLGSNNDSISTPEITPQSTKVQSFSLISILRKAMPLASFAIAFFSPSQKYVAEKEEHNDVRSHPPSPDIISSKSQPIKNINIQPTVFKRWLNIASFINRSSPNHKTVNTKSKPESIESDRVNLENVADVPLVANNKQTVPDRWSNIAELINQSSPTNDVVNAKFEADSLEKNEIDLENISGTKQASNKDNKQTIPDRWSSIAELINQASPTNDAVNAKSDADSLEENKIDLENVGGTKQASNKDNKQTIPDRWSNIAELINQPSPTNDAVNAKFEADSLEKNEIDLENISGTKQASNKDNKQTIPDRWSSIAELINQAPPRNDTVNAKSDADSLGENEIDIENVSGVEQVSNKSETPPDNKLPKLPKNYPIQSSKSQGQNLDIDRDNRVYKVQLSPENTTRSGYEYQSLNPKTNFPEKKSFDKPSIQENNDNILSRQEEIGAENKTETKNSETTKNSEIKTPENEDELIEILAGEIYNLLQQRLEIERERQGNYYL